MEDESKINTLNIGSGKTPLNSGEMGLDRIFQAGYEIIDGSLFIIADVANLPFKDGYFERVYIDFPDLNIIMTLLENYKQSSFYEIARVLKSGGKMSILIDIDQAGVHASYGQSVHQAVSRLLSMMRSIRDHSGNRLFSKLKVYSPDSSYQRIYTPTGERILQKTSQRIIRLTAKKRAL